MHVSDKTPRFALGSRYLALAGLSSALIYGAMLLRLPLLTIYSYPLKNLNDMAPSEWMLGLSMVVCVVLLFGAYAFGGLGVASGQGQSSTMGMIVGFPLLFVALLLFTHPITSTDVYDYLFRGRMLAHYGVNTFVVTPQQLPGDPLLPYVAWKHVVTAYGPLWEGMSWLTARLAGERPGAPATREALLGLIMAYKALALLGYLLCGAALWFVLGRVAPQQRRLGLYLWLWNPLVLWETIAAAHNDAWMALPIILALGMLMPAHQGQEAPAPDEGAVSVADSRPAQSSTMGKPIAALLILTAGGLIKYLAFFFGPLLLVAAARRLSGWGARLRLALSAGLLCAAMILFAYAPFWAGWATLNNIGDRRALYHSTLLAALKALLAQVLPEDQTQTIIAITSLVLLLLGVCWASWRAWRAPQDVARHVLWLMLWFLVIASAWFQPWYLVWAVALAALQPWRVRVIWGIGLFSCTALLSYIVAGLVLPGLGLEATSFLRPLALAIFICAPPLIVLAWGRPLIPAALWRFLRQLPRRVLPTRAPRLGS